MKLLSRLLAGSPAHPPVAPERGQQMVPGATIPPRQETAPAPPPVASGAGYREPVHWLETATKFGTPIGTLACDADASDDTVVSVRRDEVTCPRCMKTAAWKAKCTATTSRHELCKLDTEPGSDRCAMPSHSHQAQP